MQRFLVATALALLMLLGSGQLALAGVKWCAVDPILTVDGRDTDVTVAFDETSMSAVLPPVRFLFHVPSNSKVSVAMPASPIAYTVELRYDLPERRKGPVSVTVETFVGATALFETHTIVQVSKVAFISVVGVSGSTTSISYTLK